PFDWQYFKRLRFRYYWKSWCQHSIFYLRYNQNYGATWRFNLDYFVYTKLFPPRENQKDTWTISWDLGKYCCCSAWYSNTVLLLFVHSVIYRIYKCRSAAWSYFFFLNFFSYG